MIEYYISELLSEGIYHIPTWTEMSCASVSVEGETTSLSMCDVAAAAVAGTSGLLRAASSSSSTMHLGASAGNIAIDSEGCSLLVLSYVVCC